MPNVKFEFNGKLGEGKYWDKDSNKRVAIELEDNDLTVDELLEEFMNFLQAIGYEFEIGDRFQVVNHFKDWKKVQSKIDLDLDSNGTSQPDFGAVPPHG